MFMTDNLPKVWTQRIRDKKTLEKFEILQERLEDLNRQYSSQNAGIFAINLAYEKLEELEEKEEEIRRSTP